jgi:hypothetical protein
VCLCVGTVLLYCRLSDDADAAAAADATAAWRQSPSSYAPSSRPIYFTVERTGRRTPGPGRAVIALTKRTDALDELTRTVLRSEFARGRARAVLWHPRFEAPRRLFDRGGRLLGNIYVWYCTVV